MVRNIRELRDAGDLLLLLVVSEECRYRALGLVGNVHLCELRLGLHVDAPIGEAIRKADVQSLLPDGEGELILRHDRQSLALRLIKQNDLVDLGGRKSVADELTRVYVVLQNVDLLALELPYDSLDPDSPEPDTGTNGVDVLPIGVDRQFGPISGFPNDLEDLYRLVVDLRNFQLEDPADELRVRSRQDDLKSGRGLCNLVNQRLDTFIRPIDLTR